MSSVYCSQSHITPCISGLRVFSQVGLMQMLGCNLNYKNGERELTSNAITSNIVICLYHLIVQ